MRAGWMNKAAAAASFMASFRWPAGITRMGRCHGMHGPSSAVVLGGTWKLKASNHHAGVSCVESGTGGQVGRDGELKRRGAHLVAADQRLADDPLMLSRGLVALSGDLF